LCIAFLDCCWLPSHGQRGAMSSGWHPRCEPGGKIAEARFGARRRDDESRRFCLGRVHGFTMAKADQV
jgi:hypothetical protein